jgi:hypothetical protein
LGVDQTRDEDRGAEVDLRQPPEPARHGGRGTDVHDRAGVDRDGAAGDRRPGDGNDLVRPEAERVVASGARRRRRR